MTRHRCCVCGNARTTDPSVSFHRFPKEQDRRALWLSIFELSKDNIKASTTRVCLRHFPDGDSRKPPSTSLGKYIVSIYRAATIEAQQLCACRMAHQGGLQGCQNQ